MIGMNREYERDQKILALERRVDMLERLVLHLDQRGAVPLLQPSVAPPPASPLAPLAPRQGFSDPASDADPTWIPILHTQIRPDPASPPPCGFPGVYLTEPPQDKRRASLDVMRVRTPEDLRWHIPQPGIDPPICSSCFVPIDPFSNADLDYLSHMLPAGSPPSPPTQTPKTPRTPRSKSGDDRGGGVVPPQPTGGGSSASPGVDAGLPSTFVGHTPEATAEALQGIGRIQKLAQDAGLFEGYLHDTGRR